MLGVTAEAARRLNRARCLKDEHPEIHPRGRGGALAALPRHALSMGETTRPMNSGDANLVSAAWLLLTENAAS